MDNHSFFARWEASQRLTQDTLKAFPDDTLGQEIIQGLRPPGEMYCHIYAHVNAVLNACLTRAFDFSEMGKLPTDVDCTDREALLRYSRITMNTLFAHSGQPPKAWKQKINTPGGSVLMEALCRGAYDHEVHHRGQLVAMLKHLGIKPPQVAATPV